jgi:RNA-directed DNA polymerase
VIEDEAFAPTEEGAPQGGVVSPLLLNVALHGMEQAAGVRYYRDGGAVPGCPVLVRYADDLIALCHTRQQAEQVQARLAGWLGPRGLVFNQDKTKITHLDQGVDFLGFEIRRFGGKLLTKPSKDALRRIRKRLSAEVKALRGANADAVIKRLNPIITGWAAYYRIGVSSRAYARLDAYLWRLAWKWARHAHPNKPRRWVVTRYFGMFNPSRNDTWVFGSRDTGYYLRKFAWTKIVRHRMVAGRASPDDPALAGYWATRRQRVRPPVSPATWHLLRRQHGRCPLCRGLLLYASHEPHDEREWEQWHTIIRKATRKHAVATVMDLGRPDEQAAHHLIHAHCRRRTGSTSPALLPGLKPPGLA